MQIDKPGKVTDRITLLGRRESCVYLVDGGDECALVGGGMVSIIPDMLDQLKFFAIREEKIKRMFILHSHFDHCGIAPFFKKRWPWVNVTASPRAKELLATSGVVDAIAFMNLALLEKYGLKEKAKEFGMLAYDAKVGDTAKGGDIIPCGDLCFEIIDVPGHSSCSIAAYIPSEKALFASDASGIPFGDGVMTAANSNFDKYEESLEKMAGYDIEAHFAEHYGARTGTDARSFIAKSRQAAKEARSILVASLERTGDIKTSTEEITAQFMENAPKDFLGSDVIRIVVGQMLAYLDKRKRKTEGQ